MPRPAESRTRRPSSKSTLNYLAPDAARVRKLANEVREPNRSLLLKLAEEIEANPGRGVRVRITRSRKVAALDVETGSELLQLLQR